MGTLLPFLLLLPAGQEPVAAGERVERHLAAMGTALTLEVWASDRAVALRASERAVRAIEATERRLSTWRDDSELARLNATPPGVELELSEILAGELSRARELWRETEGAFDPGLGGLVDAWGLRGSGRRPEDEELRAALAPGGLASLALAGRRAARLHAGLRLEEGAFGKGAGLDAALGSLRAAGITRARVDLGGQVAVLSPTPVPIPVADPDERERPRVEVAIDGGSLATSGNSERGLVVDGVAVGHLLDPRTGRPAPDFGSLSVWAPDALTADALSTGLYVLGPEAALKWAAAREGVEVLVLQRTPNGLRARATRGLAAATRVLDTSFSLEIHPRGEDAPRSP